MQRSLLITAALLAPWMPSCACEEFFLQEQKGPAMALGTELLDFGDVVVGSNATRAIRVENRGDQPLVVQSVEVSPASAPFSTAVEQLQVESGSPQDLQVTFTPPMEGSFAASVTLTSNDGATPTRTVTLQGRGVPPGMGCSTGCTTVPAPTCADGTTVQTSSNGRCQDGQCVFDTTDTACPMDQVCMNGACMPAGCSGDCTSVPAPSCADGTTVRTSSNGRCENNQCVFDTTDTACPMDQVCMNGACMPQVIDCTGAPAATRVTTDATHSGGPHLVLGSSEMGLFFVDSPTTSANNQSHRFVSLDLNGTPTRMPATVSTMASAAHPPSVGVFNGTGYATTFSDIRSGDNDIHFMRINSDGTRNGTEVEVTSHMVLAFIPDMVWNSGAQEYALAWNDSRDAPMPTGHAEIYFTRLSADGQAVGGHVRLTEATGYKEAPSITFNGTEYALAWHDDRSGTYQIYFTRVSTMGVKQGSDVLVSTGSAGTYGAEMVWNGSAYRVVWTDQRSGRSEVWTRVLGSDGTPAGSDSLLVASSGNALRAQLAWSGSGYGLVWQDTRSGINQVYFQELDANGATVGPARNLSCAAAQAYSPHVAWTGSNYMVAWGDARNGDGDVFVTTVPPVN